MQQECNKNEIYVSDFASALNMGLLVYLVNDLYTLKKQIQMQKQTSNIDSMVTSIFTVREKNITLIRWENESRQ